MKMLEPYIKPTRCCHACLPTPINLPHRHSACDHSIVIGHHHFRCNAGRNHHVRRQKFSANKQGVQQAADDWLCELRDLAQNCEFKTDFCARCEPTRILGQLIIGVESDEIHVKLLEQGDTLTLDQALAILSKAEASNKQ